MLSTVQYHTVRRLELCLATATHELVKGNICQRLSSTTIGLGVKFYTDK